MTIVHFTPLEAALGGILIGLSAVLLLAALGRIAGISGIAFALLDEWRDAGQSAWRALFIVGMVLGVSAWYALSGQPVAPARALHPAWLVAAGLLVGYGTSMSNGCTSGHGVCGLSRLSVRSLAAVLMFMATAGITVFVMRHVLS